MTAIVAVLVAFGMVEAGLRLAGRRAWVSYRTNPVEPTLHDPDPVLGWVLRPGHWRYGPYVAGGETVEVTIADDRSRRTRPAAAADGKPELLLVGCSFTFGWGVSDDETYAWGVQTLRPDLDVRNRGTGAYGTLQALLLLERELASGDRPAEVVYGFISDHAVRNVGGPTWMRALAMFTGQNIVTVPYCELDGGGALRCHPPEPYPRWPLRERSAAITLLQDGAYELEARRRAASADEVTRRLVLEMAERCRAAGVRFSLLLLKVGTPRRDAIVPFALAHDIDLIDCDRPMGPGDNVRGDVHPNARVHQAWAACLARAVRG